MEVLATEAVVLMTLADGPAAGASVAARARSRLGDERALGPGTLYPVLRRLEAAGLVRSWAEAERSGVGRPRRFHELTLRGIEALESQRSLLRRLASPPGGGSPSVALVRRMRANLRRAFAVSAFASRLRARVSREARP